MTLLSSLFIYDTGKSNRMKLNTRTIKIISQVLFFILFAIIISLSYKQSPPDWYKNLPQTLSPLSLIITLIADKTIHPIMLSSIVVIVSTIITGRVFCGYVCPLGAIIDTADYIFGRIRGRVGAKLPAFLYNIKYSLLIVAITLAIIGSTILLILDPLSLTSQLFTVILFPFFNTIGMWLVKLLLFLGVSPFSDTVVFIEKELLFESPPVYRFTPFILIICFILLLSIITRRGWCRYICPLGALLSLIGTRAPFARQLTDDCIGCGACERLCRMGILAESGMQTRKSECILCGECAFICAKEAVLYTARGKHKTDSTNRSKFLLTRRTLFTGLGIGFLSIIPIKLIKKKDTVIRPPGTDRERLEKLCLRCGLCIRVCPTNALQHDILHTSLSALFTPQLVARVGPCSFNCNLCGRVCPSGAIPKLTLKIKQKTRMGQAEIVRATCLSWLGETCMLCQEVCPTPTKAIITRHRRNHPEFKGIPAPEVDKDLCIGCGYCENICPVEPPAIKVHPLEFQ
ncbi:MAG: hypothetical protein DRH49_07965 [Candidatus Coatesbacteria bacterium]|nr:MAG: hypothetical protein DRH49_07965 [Candidatus Coatesbacteria bacterium]